MTNLFTNVLEASFYGSIVIALVLILRLILKKAPRWSICLLWLLAAVRLIFPFDIQSSFSLQPDMTQLQQIQTEIILDSVGQAAPAVPDNVVFPNGEDVQIVVQDDAVIEEVHRAIDWGRMASYVWIAVAAGMGLYSIAAYLRLKHRVREAVKVYDNVYECAGLDTAFVLGYLWPRIYIPMGLENPKYIVDHERAHILRGDHWFKLLMFAALAIHWFNPMVWAAYLCTCKDLEMACDERVVRDFSLEQRKAYSAALLACSAGHRSFAACPVAFGEVSVKSRILGVLNYRKPRFWICLLAVIAVAMVSVCFMTNPVTDAEHPDHSSKSEAGEVEPLTKCKEALLAFQSSESCHVTVDWKFEGDVLHETSYQEYWKNGDDWLHVTQIAEANVFFAAMEVNGIQYESVMNENGSQYIWKQSLLENEDQYKTWLNSFDFDAQEVVLLDYQAALGEEMIRFSVITDQKDGMDAGDTVTFFLDADCLKSVVYTQIVTQEASDVFEAKKSTATLTIISMNNAEAADAIEAQLSGSSNQIEQIENILSNEIAQQIQERDALERCKTALANLQASANCYMTGRNEFYAGSHLNSETQVAFYLAGNEWLRIADVQQGASIHKHLYLDGVLFNQMSSNGPSTQSPEWMLVNTGSESTLWPFEYVWNPDAVLVSAESEEGMARITVKVNEPVSVSGMVMDTHTLEVCLDEAGDLKSIMISNMEDPEDADWNGIRMTMEVVSTSPDAAYGILEECRQQVDSKFHHDSPGA